MIELARLREYCVEETDISVHEAMEADEIFTTGTAVVLCAVGSLSYQVCQYLTSSRAPQAFHLWIARNWFGHKQGKRKQFTSEGQPGRVAQELFTALTDIQMERAEDSLGWVHSV